jgi:hypothetical protein
MTGEGESLEAWLRERTPEIPEAFRPHLLSSNPEAFPEPGTLGDLGAGAIAEALAAPGRNREAAFRLLAGDALLTYACEAAGQEEDPGSWLEYLLARLGDHFR